MALTATQLRRRQMTIGASDVPVIMMRGRHPWTSITDLFLEKTGMLAPKEPSKAMQAGVLFENALLQFAELQLGKRVHRAGQTRAHPNGVMTCHLDGRVVDDAERATIEAKTQGLFNPFWKSQDWGDDPDVPMDDLDQPGVPEVVFWQVQAQMAVLNAGIREAGRKANKEITEADLYSAAYVPVLLPAPRGPTLFKVLRNDGRIAQLEQEVCEFWDNHLVANVPPSDPPTMEAARRIIRVPDNGDSVEVPLDLWRAGRLAYHEWDQVNDLLKERKAARDRAEAAILAAMGTSRRAHSTTGDSVKLLRMEQSARTVKAHDRQYWSFAPVSTSQGDTP